MNEFKASSTRSRVFSKTVISPYSKKICVHTYRFRIVFDRPHVAGYFRKWILFSPYLKKSASTPNNCNQLFNEHCKISVFR